jgi:hypothetical protein
MPGGAVPLDVVPLDIAEDCVAAALVDLQRRAYAVEAALIGHDGIPQLTETVPQLRSAGLSGWAPSATTACRSRRSPTRGRVTSWTSNGSSSTRTSFAAAWRPAWWPRCRPRG